MYLTIEIFISSEGFNLLSDFLSFYLSFEHFSQGSSNGNEVSHLSRNVLISPSLWRTLLLYIGFSVDSSFFPLSTLNILAPGPQSFLWEKSDDRIEYPLYVMNCFLLLSRSSIFDFQKFYYNVSWCGSLWVHLTWSLLNFLDIYIHVFHQIWKVFWHYFSKYPLCPLSFSSLSGTLALNKWSVW